MDNKATETILTPVNNELEKHFKLPEIYSLWHPMFPNGRKVGFSTVTDKRKAQWDKILPGIELKKRWSSLIDDGSGRYFDDHSVHKGLIRSGKRRIPRDEFPKDTYYTCEYFDETTEDDIDNSVNNVKFDIINGSELHKCKDIHSDK